MSHSAKSIAIYGPTASGKTAVSLLLSEQLNIEIVSADSRQVFRGLDIGTAKVSVHDRERIPHFGIDICDPRDSYSTGEYRRYARDVINDIKSRGHLPVVIGGTGLYVSSLVTDFLEEDVPGNDRLKVDTLRAKIHAQREAGRHEELYEELQRVDNVSAERYADKNPRRIDRALLYYYVNGEPLSRAQQTKTIPAEEDLIVFVVECDRDQLNNRIRTRVMEMWDSGFENEVQNLLNLGVSPKAQSLATVGYREMLKYLDGRCSKEQAQEMMILATRQYAKRQRTWGRHQFSSAVRLSGSPVNMVDSLLRELQARKYF